MGFTRNKALTKNDGAKLVNENEWVQSDGLH